MITYLLVASVVAIVVIWAFGTHWLYLCRSSLLGLLILAVLPLLAVSILKGLLIGVFDLESRSTAFAVGMLLFLASWAVTSTSDLVLDLAPTRLGDRIPPFGKYLRAVRAALIVVAMLVNLVAILVASEFRNGTKIVEGFSLGVFAGFVLFAFFQLVRNYWNTRQYGDRLLKKRESVLSRKDVKLTNPTEGFCICLFAKASVNVPSWLGRGYLLKQSDQCATLLPGHLQSVLALVAMLLVYWTPPLFKIAIPSLCSLLLLITISTWLFSGIAFFLDAYRIPVFFSLIGIVWLSSLVNKSNHFYRIWDAPQVNRLRAADVLSRAADDETPVVLVAAAGGGIQAAAWTARVLVGLEEELDGSKPGTFAKSVRLLSGVSGGSTGIMYYVHATYPLSSSTLSKGELHKHIFRVAEASSLDPAVFGLAYYDFQRFLFPVFVQYVYRDRAEALETAWIQNEASEFKNSLGRTLKEATLNGWSRDLIEGKRPAVIFNSTIVETGERLTFSTTRFETLAPSQQDFAVTYQAKDVSISTAVRLSATFPVVSPSAGPATAEKSTDQSMLSDQTKVPQLHLVDGGYFDTSGLTSLSTWLDDGLQVLVAKEPERVPRKILVIQILPFPKPESAPISQQSLSETDGADSESLKFSHIFSPLQALFSVRDHVQVGMADATFDSVAKRWQLEAYNPCSPGKDRLSPIQIQLSTIEFLRVGEDTYTPLSWHLRQSEQKAIDESWEKFRNSQEMRKIKKFFE